MLAFVVIANRRHTDLFEWAPAQHVLHPARGDPAPAAAGRVHLRGRRLHPLGVAGARGRHRRRHLRLQPGPRRPAPVDDRRDGTRRGQRPDGHPVRRQPAKHPPRRRVPARAGAAANQALLEHAVRHRHRGLRDRPAGPPGPAHRRARRWSTPGTSPPTCAGPGTSAPVPLPADLPLGMFPDTAYRSTDLDLEPGDRLVLVTDGMLERNAATLDLIAEISLSRALHPREATRAPHRQGPGGHRPSPGRRRHHAGPGLVRRPRSRADTVAGADPIRASAATSD